MKRKVASLILLLSLLALAAPAFSQSREGGFIRRGRNGVRVGEGRIKLFDGPGILNYEHKHRWMPGAGGAATVIGIGAGAGAGTGAVVGGKKGAVIGALAGAGGATALWLYKNRRHSHRIF
jgi:hypothetical protein